KKETKEEEKPSLLNEITDISIVVDITLPITEYKQLQISKSNIEIGTRRRKHKSRWIYKYKDLNEEGWKEFAQAMEEKIDEIENGATNNEEGLDKVWNRFINELRQIMKAKIPRMKISPRKFYAFSKIATKLHTA
ncbi:21662_t:CDS:2, partial [Gigaspora rosea]